MANIATADAIALKWATVTPQRAPDYEDGIRNPRADWALETAKAQGAWESGVQKSIASKSFSKGVTRAGTSKWQDGALSKGVIRWGPGVALAQEAYQTGFAPFRDAIARVTLPPRGPRRDPRNLERVKVIVDALIKTKESQGG